MSLREILVDWTTISGSGKVSVFYFDNTGTVATQRTALNTLLTAVKAHLDNSTVYTVRTEGREIDQASGGLIGFWTETSAKTGVGGGTTEPVADATQALLRWKTSTIFGGRRVIGRTYIPGVSNSNEQNGDLIAATVTAFAAAAQAMATAGAGLQIWHRPLRNEDGDIIADGNQFDVTSGTCWKEFAVLRRRRK